jgi:hypothetical protein
VICAHRLVQTNKRLQRADGMLRHRAFYLF